MKRTDRERSQADRLEVLLQLERQLRDEGVRLIAGVDEVGVGPLAGPVVAAAVILPSDLRLRGVDDSKKLRPALREELAQALRAEALAYAVGIVAVEDIDRLNIYHATLEAMRRAVVGLSVPPEHLLVDARTIPGVSTAQTALVGGDARSYSIAAASILAKSTRDALMRDLDALYPQYGFARHMGYGTPQHLAALASHGPCPAHRRSFAPVRQLRLV